MDALNDVFPETSSVSVEQNNLESTEKSFSDAVTLIQENRIDELYDIMRKTYYERGDESLFENAWNVMLPEEHRTSFHPREFYPVRAINEFLKNKGEDIWVNIRKKNYTWLHPSAYEGHEFLQHPVTGNTIFHEDPDLIYFYDKLPQSDLRKNWEGTSVLNVSSLKEYFNQKKFSPKTRKGG